MSSDTANLVIIVTIYLCISLAFAAIGYSVAMRRRDGRKERVYQLVIFLIAVIFIALSTLFMSLEQGFQLPKLINPLSLILLQFGCSIILVEFFTLNYLLEIKIPKNIFRHGYFDIANQKELEMLLKDIVRAYTELEKEHFSDDELLQTYFRAVRKFIKDTFQAPLRVGYQATIRLSDEQFKEIILNDEKVEERVYNNLLSITIIYEYTTEKNQSKKSVKINQSGIIHRVDDTVPDCSWLYEEFKKKGGKISKSIIKNWIKKNFKPAVKVSINNEPGKTTDGIIDPRTIDLDWDKNGQLRIVFPIYSNIEIPHDSQAKVTYTQQMAAELADKHHWVAFSRTNGFSFRHDGFEEKGYRIIPIAEATFWSRIPGVHEQECRPSIATDLIELPGLVFPGSVFGYFWYPTGPK